MHILLFILFFIIAIIVFGLSIVGFHVKNDFRIRTPFVFITHETNRTKANKATIKGSTVQMMMKRKYLSENLPEERQKNIHPG